MSEIPTRDEILTASAKNGLVAYLFGISATEPALYQNNTFLAAVTELVNAGDVALFTEQDKVFLNETKSVGPPFFLGVHLLCELVPYLHVGHRELMELIATLVRLGGQDGAAKQPNVAFRDWCAADLARVRAVVKDALAGDKLAMAHLTFALEAGEDSSNALMFLKETSKPEAQRGAAVALGRMPLDDDSAATAVRALADMSLNSQDNNLAANALLSCFAILEKNKILPRKEARDALDKTLEDSSADTLHLLATLLWHHGKSLQEEERQLILNALLYVKPEDIGTLQRIDFALSALAQEGQIDAVSTLVAGLIKHSQGKIGINTFPRWRSVIFGNDNRCLGKLVADWLLDGNIYLCSSLAEQINITESRLQAFDLEAEDLPNKPEEQWFLCRKAVGFLFPSPVAAAAVLIAVLRHGDCSMADTALDLLYMPLLMSYGDGEALPHYLEEVVASCLETDVARRINEKLDLKRQNTGKLDGIEALVELHPNEIHRHIAQIRTAQRMDRVRKEGEKQSVFYDLVNKQHLLYGNTWATYATGPQGEARQHRGEMKEFSFSIEYPLLDIVDTVGLHMSLHQFKHEQLIDQ